MNMKIGSVVCGKKNKDRVNVYGEDGSFLFAVYGETAVRYGLKAGMELHEDRVCGILREDEEKYAMECALHLLSCRQRTKNELCRKLKEKKLSQSAIDSTVVKLEELGYVDDYAFAVMYAEELQAKYGARMIKAKLVEKGVPRGLADEATAGIDQQELCDNYARAIYAKNSGMDSRKLRDKAYRSLAAKGFSVSEIGSSLKKITEDEEL